ncbi:hypothetical protein CEP53_010887 [Fusarium sp. AF-6]|nr:hypothetical protein CEP53_010887 [Fusarium sp. AF-6]
MSLDETSIPYFTYSAAETRHWAALGADLAHQPSSDSRRDPLAETGEQRQVSDL